MKFNLFKLYTARIPELDGLRGIAVVMVLIFHYINNQLSPLDLESGILSTLKVTTSFFWSGVDLFFILSGFLIGSILLKYKGQKNYFKTFYIRRFLRIVPVFYLLLICYILLREINIPDPGNFLFRDELPLFPFFLFLQNYVQAAYDTFGPVPLGPTWSLAVEEQFYLILPSIIFFTPKKWLPFIVLPCILAAPFFRYFAETWYKSYFPFQMRMDTLFFGVLLAYLVVEKNLIQIIEKKKLITLAFFLLFLALGVILSLTGKIGVFNHSIFMVLYGLFLLISLAFKQTFLGNFLRSKVLRFLGFLSYSIYLFHQLFSGILHAYIFNDIPVLSDVNRALVTFLSFFLTVLFSYLLHLVLERPIIAYGHKFKYS
jgi:peptidoglycan/LPS O-acetylase OafA/YrhL